MGPLHHLALKMNELPPGGMTEGHGGCGLGLQSVSDDEEFQTSSGRPMYQSETYTQMLKIE